MLDNIQRNDQSSKIQPFSQKHVNIFHLYHWITKSTKKYKNRKQRTQYKTQCFVFAEYKIYLKLQRNSSNFPIYAHINVSTRVLTNTCMNVLCCVLRHNEQNHVRVRETRPSNFELGRKFEMDMKMSLFMNKSIIESLQNHTYMLFFRKIKRNRLAYC